MSEFLHGYPVDGVAVKEVDAVHLFLENIPALVRRARSARPSASSYRVKVGAAAFGLNPYTGEQIIRSGGNLKTKKQKETICGEKNVASAIQKIDGAAKIIGMVVIGPMDEETIASINADIVTETLHPCWRCRLELPRMSCVTDETIILSGGGGVDGESATTNLFQAHTIGQLVNLYNQPSNVVFNQDTPLVNVSFRQATAVYDNLVRDFGVDEVYTPAKTAIKALHLLSN